MSSEVRSVTKEEVGKEIVKEKKKIKKAEKKGERIVLSPPPAPPINLNNVSNPIIESKGLKRALAVAIVAECTHDDKFDETRAGLMVRASGILFKAGYKEGAETNPLTQSEWSGRPYVRFVTNTSEGKAYVEKFPEKVEKCKNFAHELAQAYKEERAKQKEAKALEAQKEMNKEIAH
jgi:hypothetical protein